VGGVPSGFADLYKHKNRMVMFLLFSSLKVEPGKFWLY
jgi:hypothetical protein